MADTTEVKVDRSNGPVEFGQRAEWKNAPVHYNAKLGIYEQGILGTEWFKNHMRDLARQLKSLGKLDLFPSLKVWDY
jgi:hypothetical protein